MTYDEIAAVLDAYWEFTGTVDPWTNGVMEAELVVAGDPNDPALTPGQRREVIGRRHAITDRHKWHHDLTVGQRVACRQLKYRFAAELAEKVPA